MSGHRIPDYLNPPPVPINILMVTDKNGSFRQVTNALDAERGLHTLIDSLAGLSGWVNLSIKKGHREPFGAGTFNAFAATADEGFQRFQFRYTGAAARSLENFDELWLFGIQENTETGSDPTTLAPEEVSAIDQFMSARRGVLAMGDHYTLGTPLCGGIPRVRRMRHWAAADSPTALGPTRHDTRIKVPPSFPQADFDAQVSNEFERDAIPQRIRPVIYGGGSVTSLFRSGYPHPLLCGPRGAITVLPDHMHEGDCYVPSDLSEFHDIAPEVIAYGTNRAGGATNRSFGLISVYDGDDAGVGRVVVDSTWHHFVHLNVQGFARATDPAGMQDWADIQAYFRNLVLWLAPPEKRRRLLENSLWYSRWHERMDEKLASAQNGNPTHLVYLGRTGKDVLGRLTSRCWMTESLIDLIQMVSPNLGARPMLSPWWKGKGEKDKEPLPLLDPELVYESVLGGILLSIYRKFPSPSVKPDEIKSLDKSLPVLIQEGAREGLKAFEGILQSSLPGLANVQKKLQESYKNKRRK
jgi:hypothetical protein